MRCRKVRRCAPLPNKHNCGSKEQRAKKPKPQQAKTTKDKRRKWQMKAVVELERQHHQLTENKYPITTDTGKEWQTSSMASPMKVKFQKDHQSQETGMHTGTAFQPSNPATHANAIWLLQSHHHTMPAFHPTIPVPWHRPRTTYFFHHTIPRRPAGIIYLSISCIWNGLLYQYLPSRYCNIAIATYNM